MYAILQKLHVRNTAKIACTLLHVRNTAKIACTQRCKNEKKVRSIFWQNLNQLFYDVKRTILAQQQSMNSYSGK